MRVIKFRGKSLNTGLWVYGDLTQRGKRMFIEYEVNPETIGQFIGLFDKNGQEIYEGDIVRKITKSGYPDNFVGEIVFRNGLFGFKNDNQYGLPVSIIVKSSKWVDGNASGTSTYEYEVIGNIYDDTELLKEYDKDF
jgi:uncharacterized phage protein (TIGR01671 family)